MLRIINTKLTAALALSRVSHQINNAVIQLELEQDLDGIVQLCKDLMLEADQLSQDPSKEGSLVTRLTRMDNMLQGVHFSSEGLLTWERMLRLAKLDALKAMVREAKALLMAHATLPVTPERRRPPRTPSLRVAVREAEVSAR